MNSAETEAFRRGVTLSCVYSTVREAVIQVFKRYPKDVEHLSMLDPSEIATKIIINIYHHLNMPVPTMEEAIINIETINAVESELLNLNLAQEEIFRRKKQQEGPQDDNNKNSEMFRLSKKERDELR
jgi:hypothetical protein